MSTQMLLYLHVLHCLYGADTEVEMLVRCSFFYKSKPNEFAEHPINRSPAQMQTWQNATIAWLDAESADKSILEDSSTDDEVLSAYPLNTTACFNYGRRCMYFDYCDAWSNPLTRCDAPPMGMQVVHWNPLELPEIKEIVDLTQKDGDNHGE